MLVPSRCYSPYWEDVIHLSDWSWADVVVFEYQSVHTLNVITCKELIPSGVCDGPDERVCDRLDEVGNGRPDEGVCDRHDEVDDLLDEGVYDGPDEVRDLSDEVRTGTSRIIEECDKKLNKESVDRAIEGADDNENDELMETNYEQEKEDIATETYVDLTGD
ncbi:hypothetical protein Ddye_029560 [Dipteronia dyeriana]|uniref:Uncharacterized protein n=1 Tax=Dipteronia dyeriana TaxID=168575 RepID=A0AAD9TFC7_9ROSI|nr:hypothetical protein Ddye_029560 [Dipteronia dyeriana]